MLPLMILCSTVVLHLCPSVAKNVYSVYILNLTLYRALVKKKIRQTDFIFAEKSVLKAIFEQQKILQDLFHFGA